MYRIKWAAKMLLGKSPSLRFSAGTHIVGTLFVDGPISIQGAHIKP